jgi:hypothetical protein
VPGVTSSIVDHPNEIKSDSGFRVILTEVINMSVLHRGAASYYTAGTYAQKGIVIPFVPRDIRGNVLTAEIF